jgi:hypothetical protein
MQCHPQKFSMIFRLEVMSILIKEIKKSFQKRIFRKSCQKVSNLYFSAAYQTNFKRMLRSGNSLIRSLKVDQSQVSNFNYLEMTADQRSYPIL